MKFDCVHALILLEDGRAVRREKWPKNKYICLMAQGVVSVDWVAPDAYVVKECGLKSEDIVADDWEIQE